jgi:hypothetical protein
VAELDASARATLLEESKGKTCRCGHSVNHLMVSPEPEYSGLGSFWIYFMGVTISPKILRFRCRVCKQTIHNTRTQSVLNNYH